MITSDDTCCQGQKSFACLYLTEDVWLGAEV